MTRKEQCESEPALTYNILLAARKGYITGTWQWTVDDAMMTSRRKGDDEQGGWMDR